MSNSTDRLPPHSPDAERGVIGCILLDPAASISECVARLGASGEAFFELRYRIIYEFCAGMADSLKPVDMLTVAHELKVSGQFEKLGGAEFLTGLADGTPSSANLSYYLDILEEKFELRRMVATCTRIVARIYDGETDGLIDDAEREVLAVRSVKSRPGCLGIKELTGQAVDAIEKYHQQQGVISGLTTGLTDLDMMTEGLHAEEMTVIAAYPGNGKTSLAINVAEHAAIDVGISVGIFSLEMSAMQLVLRMLASRSRVNLRNVREGILEERDFPKLTASAIKIAASKIFLDDVSALSINQIRASARRMAQQHGIKLILIDYIQLIGSQSKREQNREQEVSEISRGIKSMAKELKLPVLALSQLNDDGKLRESRAIGQDADNVWVLEPEDDEEDQDVKAMVLKIRKQRNGPTGNVHLTFLKCFTRFESAAKVSQEDAYQPNIKNVGRNPYAE